MGGRHVCDCNESKGSRAWHKSFKLCSSMLCSSFKLCSSKLCSKLCSLCSSYAPPCLHLHIRCSPPPTSFRARALPPPLPVHAHTLGLASWFWREAGRVGTRSPGIKPEAFNPKSSILNCGSPEGIKGPRFCVCEGIVVLHQNTNAP